MNNALTYERKDVEFMIEELCRVYAMPTISNSIRGRIHAVFAALDPENNMIEYNNGNPVGILRPKAMEGFL